MDEYITMQDLIAYIDSKNYALESEQQALADELSEEAYNDLKAFIGGA